MKYMIEYVVNLPPRISVSIKNIKVVNIPINSPFFNPFCLFAVPVINPVVNVIIIIDNKIMSGCISILNRLKIENIRGSNNRAEKGINNNLIVLFMLSPSRLYVKIKKELLM